MQGMLRVSVANGSLSASSTWCETPRLTCVSWVTRGSPGLHPAEQQTHREQSRMVVSPSGENSIWGSPPTPYVLAEDLRVLLKDLGAPNSQMKEKPLLFLL